MRQCFKYLVLFCASIFISGVIPLNLMASKDRDCAFPPPPPPPPHFVGDRKKKFKHILFFSKYLLDKIGVDEKRQEIITGKIKEILSDVRELHKKIMHKHDELRKEFSYIVINKNRAKKLILEISELHYKMRKIIELKKFELMLMLNVQERRKLQKFLEQQRRRFWKQIKNR